MGPGSRRALRLALMLGLPLALGALGGAPSPRQPAFAAAPTDCSATVRVVGVSPGTIRHTGPVDHFEGATVAGTFAGTFAGDRYTGVATGAQDVVLNTRTNRAQSKGQLVATTLDGSTATFRFTAQLDLDAGTGHGNVRIGGGTGVFAGVHGRATYVARRPAGIPLTWDVAIDGTCHRGR